MSEPFSSSKIITETAVQFEITFTLQSKSALPIYSSYFKILHVIDTQQPDLLFSDHHS